MPGPVVDGFPDDLRVARPVCGLDLLDARVARPDPNEVEVFDRSLDGPQPVRALRVIRPRVVAQEQGIRRKSGSHAG